MSLDLEVLDILIKCDFPPTSYLNFAGQLGFSFTLCEVTHCHIRMIEKQTLIHFLSLQVSHAPSYDACRWMTWNPG